MLTAQHEVGFGDEFAFGNIRIFKNGIGGKIAAAQVFGQGDINDLFGQW
jgi:hypothetical protein